jgi:anti-anti-sigma regulatory factor
MSASPAYECFETERVGDVWFVKLRAGRPDDQWVSKLGDELRRLITEGGARTLALEFSQLACLLSVLLGKLLEIRRFLEQRHGGKLLLCGLSPEFRGVFRVCRLEQYFVFVPDREAAQQAAANAAPPTA